MFNYILYKCQNIYSINIYLYHIYLYIFIYIYKTIIYISTIKYFPCPIIFPHYLSKIPYPLFCYLSFLCKNYVFK